MIKSVQNNVLHREKYRRLYLNGMESFERYKDIYDMRLQWKEFVLFLMTPRSGYLYQDAEKLEFLFPFPGVKKGSKIIIYAMGTYGQLLYRYVEDTHFCDVVATADRNYIELRKQGVPVISPKEMEEYDFDAIVVASSYARERAAIYQDLISRFTKEKVHIIDEELVKSDETMVAFGLL